MVSYSKIQNFQEASSSGAGNNFAIFIKTSVTKPFFIILLFISGSGLFSQADDCFANARKQQQLELRKLKVESKFYPDLDSLNKTLDYHDVDSLNALGRRAMDRVTGCKYPDTTFKATSGQMVGIDHSNSKYLILNFNDVSCDACLDQLDDLEKIKQEEKQNVTIMVFFIQDKGQLQYLSERYGDAFLFVPDARKYIEAHNLGQGNPMTYLLDKDKLIMHVSKGGWREKGKLYAELAPILE